MIVFSVAPAILSAPALTLISIALAAICTVLILWLAAAPSRPEAGLSDDLSEILLRIEAKGGPDEADRAELLRLTRPAERRQPHGGAPVSGGAATDRADPAAR